MNDCSQVLSGSSSSAPTPAVRRRLRPLVSALLAVCGGLVYSGQARAIDADVSPPMPNMMVLVDTSGSMEYKTSSDSFPLCKYDATGVIANGPDKSEKSRWIDLVEVLSGTITNYECQRLDRSSASFKNEYKVSPSSLPNSPYDFLYANPYHRPLSNGCAVGPGTVSTELLSTSFNYHTYSNLGTSCAFTQSSDGILDSYQSSVRFGLMTFDTDPSPDLGEYGTYSYVVGTAHTGMPDGCTTAQPMEVGARSAAAPPWEGRMIPFGNPEPGSLDYQNKNLQIQQVLRASRPYGATPIAGMLSDARDFLRNDMSNDPVNTSMPFGPAKDPYKSCRKSALLLLSDGQPNMDLRGHCTGAACPFQLPEDIASDLLLSKVKTYVVGFALNSLTIGTNTVDCAALKQSDLDATPTALCAANPDNAALQACCNLARIAIAGDDDPKRHAYFASNREQLRSGISSILASNLSPTSRTQAAFSGVAGSSPSSEAPAASYRFFSGFWPLSDQPWAGRLERQRWTCDKETRQAKPEPLDVNKGDYFGRNLNGGTGPARAFYTVQADPLADASVHSEYSIRPNLASNDGAGLVGGKLTKGQAVDFVANVSAASMGLKADSCDNTVNGVKTSLTADECRNKYLKWLVGLENSEGVSRCKQPDGSKLEDTCNLLGDIYHATPVVVNNPRELTRDDSYQAFIGTYAKRPMMLYTSSNDGILHAFKVASNDPEDTEKIDHQRNNELWAFVPPQVLPNINKEYPFTHQLLLDGVSVVKDVVARAGSTAAYPYVFERAVTDAGTNTNTTWRTILVQGFGGTYPGYFALDVTSPDPDPAKKLNSEDGGPKFLWQLTNDASGIPLFGSGGATPIITTLTFSDDGTVAREVPVAILPGGSGGAGTAGSDPSTPGCKRATADFGKFGSYPPRSRVPCYTEHLGARSLTIVRLDTGKIIRTFRRSKDEVPDALKALVTESPLDSPITGQPVAFPSDVGSVADRIFVGDQDGALWKLDVTNKSPDKWTMSLFWDAYPAVSIHSKPTAIWNSGQPIATAPVLSVDGVGNLTLAVSTGDQGSIGTAADMLNYLWSLRDLPNDSRVLAPDLNWVQQFERGERVTGPLSLFNSYLYFSSLRPPQGGNPCETTDGAYIWGMHYMLPPTTATSGTSIDRTVGGQRAPFLEKFSDNDPFVSDTVLLGTSSSRQAVIFGVSVAQVPTCYTEETVADAFLGSRKRMTDANSGDFQLVFQTGAANPGIGGKAETTAPPGAANVTLPKLATPARIEAWASIVE